MIYYHVASNKGIEFETSDRQAALCIHRSIRDVELKEGNLLDLRNSARARWGTNWLRGPSELNPQMTT